MHSFFSHQLHLIIVLPLTRDYYMDQNIRFVSQEACAGFFFFDYVLFRLKFSLLFKRKLGLFDFETS